MMNRCPFCHFITARSLYGNHLSLILLVLESIVADLIIITRNAQIWFVSQVRREHSNIFAVKMQWVEPGKIADVPVLWVSLKPFIIIYEAGGAIMKPFVPLISTPPFDSASILTGLSFLPEHLTMNRPFPLLMYKYHLQQ